MRLVVRVYVLEKDPVIIDLDRIRTDIARFYPEADVLFSLHIITVTQDGKSAVAYNVDWSQLETLNSHLRETRDALSGYVIPLPEDIDIVAIARDLVNCLQ